ncbi:LamG-like jellyroll fold domain-containing protein [Candidatus Poribacteria bacterium]
MRRLIVLIVVIFLMLSLKPAWAADPDLLVEYTFKEGSGDTINDVSGVGEPLNLVVEEPANVSWIPGGGLSFDDVDLAKTEGPATKIIEGCKASNEITLIVWIKPDNVDLTGPARAFTLSGDPSNRNFTFGQEKSGFEIRLRTTVTGNNGVNPALKHPEGIDTTKMSKLAYTHDDSGDTKLYIDGEEVVALNVGGDFSNWNDAYQLGIGHELNRADDLGRMWLGEYHYLAIFSRALTLGEINNLVGAPVEPQGKLTDVWGRIKTAR